MQIQSIYRITVSIEFNVTQIYVNQQACTSMNTSMHVDSIFYNKTQNYSLFTFLLIPNEQYILTLIVIVRMTQYLQ